MPTLHIAPGLFAWQLGFLDGSSRVTLASSLDAAVSGVFPQGTVISALRLDPVDGTAPVPALTSLVPATAALGAPDFTLHVHGTDFKPGDVIVWNGGEELTTVVSDTELTTGVDMGSAAVAIPVPVFVRTAVGQESNVLTFTLTPAA